MGLTPQEWLLDFHHRRKKKRNACILVSIKFLCNLQIMSSLVIRFCFWNEALRTQVDMPPRTNTERSSTSLYILNFLTFINYLSLRWWGGGGTSWKSSNQIILLKQNLTSPTKQCRSSPLGIVLCLLVVNDQEFVASQLLQLVCGVSWRLQSLYDINPLLGDFTLTFTLCTHATSSRNSTIRSSTVPTTQ